jgi:hypothetical protein
MRGRDRTGGGQLRALVALMVAGLAVVTACSSSGGGVKPIGAGGPLSTVITTTAPASSSGVSTLDATRATILARYRAGQAAFLAVAGHYPIVPTDARIPEYMTATLLTTVRNRLTTYALAGEYVQGTAELGPTVASVNGDQAVVTDCGFDHTVVVDARTGQRVGNPADTQRTQVKVTMQLVDGAWKIAALEQVGSGCVPPAS